MTHGNESPSSPPLRIDRCVCVDVTFARMRDLADERGVCDVASLQSVCGCAQSCGLCEPYIEQMLESRTVVFHTVLPPRVTQQRT